MLCVDLAAFRSTQMVINSSEVRDLLRLVQKQIKLACHLLDCPQVKSNTYFSLTHNIYAMCLKLCCEKFPENVIIKY